MKSSSDKLCRSILYISIHKNGMSLFHSYWNGVIIPFIQEWNAYSCRNEILQTIPLGIEWALHSERNEQSIPMGMECHSLPILKKYSYGSRKEHKLRMTMIILLVWNIFAFLKLLKKLIQISFLSIFFLFMTFFLTRKTTQYWCFCWWSYPLKCYHFLPDMCFSIYHFMIKSFNDSPFKIFIIFCVCEATIF